MSDETRYAGLKSFTSTTAPRYGRMKGTRNKISAAFLDDLLAVYQELGKPALFRLAKRKYPVDFLRLVAYILPKELEITDSRMRDLTDEQIDALISLIDGRLAGRAGKLESGESETLN